MFLPVPMALWGPKGFDPSWATSETAAEADRLAAAGIRTRLFAPKQRGYKRPLFFGKSSARNEAAVFARSIGFDDPVTPDGLAVFVCCHGKRDQCCAYRGQKVAAALEVIVREAGGEVYRCSHLGGHRYAATALSFPTGNLYGALDAASALASLESEIEGHLRPEHYRGCVFEEQDVQIARHALAAEGLACGVADDVAVVAKHASADETIMLVEYGAAKARIQLRFGNRTSVFYGDCRDVSSDRTTSGSMLVYEGMEESQPGSA